MSIPLIIALKYLGIGAIITLIIYFSLYIAYVIDTYASEKIKTIFSAVALFLTLSIIFGVIAYILGDVGQEYESARPAETIEKGEWL